MPSIQRRTTLLLALFIAFAQLAGAFGFYWYQLAAITSGSFTSPGTLTPDPAHASLGLSWGGVYLGAVLAGILLTLFAAKGSKLWCGVALVLLLPALPWALLLLLSP